MSLVTGTIIKKLFVKVLQLVLSRFFLLVVWPHGACIEHQHLTVSTKTQQISYQAFPAGRSFLLEFKFCRLLLDFFSRVQ
mgnify:CR=1 FL=1